jgi:hypothetical protein
METKKVHIALIQQGDMVVHEGVVRTVSGTDIHKDDGFMGKSIFGDCYRSGYKLVEKVMKL